MSNLRDLLSKANRKHEMRWKVLVFDPEKDNELVDEFKDFVDKQQYKRYGYDIAYHTSPYSLPKLKVKKSGGDYTSAKFNYGEQ